MKNGIQKSTMRIALCGIVAALSLALMMLSGLIQVGTYAFPCFAGIIISAVVIEYGCKWAAGVYAVVAVLSVFLAGDKEAVIFFIMIFGYYPIIKGLIEGKIRSRVLQYVLKFAVFNAAVVASFFICSFLLSVSPEEYTIMGFYVPWVFLIAGNVFFIVYDFAVTVLVTQYINRLRGKIFGKK